MRFGISLLPDAEPEVMSASEYFAGALQLTRMAESNDFSYVKMTEHYLHPYGGYCPNPLGFLAAVASTTKNIRLMTGCLLPVFHHPIQLASEIAMVDALSNGRVETGFARAYLPYEFKAFGVSLDESKARYFATIDALKRLLTEENVTCETPFFRFENATILPRPVQAPHPPFWGAAVRTPQSFVRLGEEGMNLLITLALTPIEVLREQIALYRTAFAASNHGRPSRVALSLPLFVAEDQRQAEELGDTYLGRYMKVWASACDSWNEVESKDYVGYSNMGHYIRSQGPQAVREARNAVVGCPTSVAEQTLRIQELLGVEEILWQVDYGAVPFELAERSLQLFIDQAMPQLQSHSMGEAAVSSSRPRPVLIAS